MGVPGLEMNSIFLTWVGGDGVILKAISEFVVVV